MREMERQLAWRLAQYEDVACDISLTAHMRHDLKNQLEVVSILVERGECDLAREHLQSMAEHAASNTQDAAS